LAVYLTFARGAVAALATGLLILVALAPAGRAQVRSVVAIVGASGLAALLATRYPDVKSLTPREAGDAADGARMFVGLAVLSLAAAAVVWRRPRRTLRVPPLPVSRSAAVLTAGAAIVVAGVVAVAVLDGTPKGSSPTSGADPARLGSVDTNRYRYWDVAIQTWAHHPVNGLGSGGFLVEWLKQRKRDDTSADAHSLYLETGAELGIVGVVFLAMFLGGIGTGVVRLYRLDPDSATGLAAILAAFAVHAGLDWDWEMPAVTLVALLAGAAALAWGTPERERLGGVEREAVARREGLDGDGALAETGAGVPRSTVERDLAGSRLRSARNP
jgi:hypothetical protein